MTPAPAAGPSKQHAAVFCAVELVGLVREDVGKERDGREGDQKEQVRLRWPSQPSHLISSLEWGRKNDNQPALGLTHGGFLIYLSSVIKRTLSALQATLGQHRVTVLPWEK